MQTPDLINVELAILFRENPNSIDLSKATKITEKAAASLGRYHGTLILDGIIELSDICAKSLTDFQGSLLSLEGLQRIKPDGARSLLLMRRMKKSSKMRQFLKDASGGVCFLDIAVAKLLIKNPYDIDISAATHISEEAADLLSARGTNGGYRDDLELDGLVTISPKSARFLARHRFCLSFNGLQEIDEHLAKAFFRLEWEKSISLNGLTKISDEAAKELANSNGKIYLKGLKTISIISAKAMLKSRSRSKVLKINLNSILPASVELGEANRFLENPGSIDFSEATRISVEAADRLAGWEGSLGLAGIADLSVAVAMARGRGEPFIDLKNVVTSSPVKREEDHGGSHTTSVTASEPNVKRHQMFDPDADEIRLAVRLVEMESQNMPNDDDSYEEDKERESMYEDLASGSEDLARSSEEGWYYSDGDID